MRVTVRIQQLIAAGAVVATTALVPLAFAAKPEPAELELLRGRPSLERLAAEAAPEAVHPVLGKVDYGTAENAFGDDRGDHMHEGHDMFAPAGTPLVAARDSVVLEAGTDGGRGNYVILYSREADQTYVYMHMIAPARVHDGERVRAGDRLGGLGCTGSCYGDHLHFEVHRGRDPYEGAIDPLPLLKRWPQAAKPEK